MSKGRKIILGVIAVIVVIAVVFSAIFWPAVSGVVGGFFSKIGGNADNTNPSPDDSDLIVLSEEEIIYQKAEQEAANRGAEAGHKIIDDKLATTTDAKQQAALYIYKSNLSSSPDGGDDYKESLEYAYKAESLYPTDNTALVVASLEDILDNAANALKYYKLYLARLTPETIELNPGDKEYYTTRVKELEAEL